jgi:osmotically-inducible protein OsmY
MTQFKRFSAMLLAAAVLATAGCAGTPTRVGEVIEDSVITTKVKAAFVNDPVVKAREVHVDTVQGEVLLTGFVNTPTEANQAVAIARNIQGVRSVRNNIRIR